MKRKPIRIDWEKLEDAFSNKNEDLVYYLDLITGHVELDGEDEDDDDVDTAIYDRNATPAATDDATRAYIEPIDNRLKLGWMRTFLDDNPATLDDDVVESLRTAMGEDDAPTALSVVLNDHVEVRDAWYRYRADRQHDMIDDWLVELEVDVVDPAPWNSPAEDGSGAV